MISRAPSLLLILGLACAEAPAPEVSSPEPETLAFAMRSQERTYEDCVAGTEGCTYVRLDYPVLTDVPEGTEDLAESVSAAIRTFVFAPLTEGPEDAPAVSPLDQFIGEFAAFKEAEPRSEASWLLERKAFVLLETEHVLSLSFVERSATGGDPPSERVRFSSFDTRTGAPLDISDVIVPGRGEALRELAETKFREARELGSEASLADAGFDFGEKDFELTTNFAIQEDGLVFYYDSGDVAPSALGPTEVEIGWDELEGLVEPRFLP